MKVHELIAKLQAMKPDAEVLIPVQDTYGDEDLYDIEMVGYDPNGSGAIVIHSSSDDWLATWPRPQRILSKSEQRVQEMANHALKSLLAAVDLTKSADYLRDRPMVSGPMRIRMPEINKLAQLNEEPSRADEQQDCAKGG